MNERVYNNGIARLRSEERTQRLEVSKVVDICLNENEINSVLDVGTGSGLFAEAFHKKNILVAGVDVNPDMIDAAKSYLPDCRFEIAPAESLPFENNSFDMTFMGVVFHEVDDFKKTFEELKRVTTKQACILEWNYEIQEFGPPMEHRLKPEFIEDLAKQTGFSSFEIKKLTNLTLYILKV